ncbi:MAG: trigger factor [Defluviitaleaceae bacterium]|nr:trigger factor [Defluviitaleaceae bacterium]
MFGNLEGKIAKSSVEENGKNSIKMTLEVSQLHFEVALNKAYLDNRDKVSLPGFRKGRVPRKMIEMQFGKNFFYESALELMFEAMYEEALQEHNLEREVVSKPSIETYEEKDGGALIVLTVDTKPHIEIKDYTGIKYRKVTTNVIDEEINAWVDAEREKNARVLSVVDRAAKKGDIANIAFEGFVDGIAFEGGQSDAHELVLGSNSFIAGFEDQIVGKNTGEEFDVDVTFPEEYHAKHLEGKPAVFKVKLNEIKEKQLPEADDTFAQEVSEFETLAEYKADIKAKIEERKLADSQREVDEQIAEGLAARVTDEIPRSMIDNEIDRRINEYANMVEQQGMNFEAYMQQMNMNINSMRAVYEVQAEKGVRSRLAIEAIIRQEDIKTTPEAMDEEIKKLAEMYRMDVTQFLEVIGDVGIRNIEGDLKAKQAVELVKKAAIAE